MNILIVTGIYPPEIGGPAQYAKNLKEVWEAQGHKVEIRIFGHFKKIPWGLRHFVFLAYIIPAVARSEAILALDSFSAGVVVVAAKLFSKKVIFRTGGDALWELYVERTGDLVLLREFYQTRLNKLSLKEKIIFYLTKWALQNLSAIVWSTEWQKNIFLVPYDLGNQKHFIIENYYGPRLNAQKPTQKNFIAATRKLKWKNLEALDRVFKREDIVASGAFLDKEILSPSEFQTKLANSYSLIIISLGDISPNTVLDAIRYRKPFIVTKETGLYDRIKECAIFVDPKNEADIGDKVLWLCNEENYEKQREKVKNFAFTHDWPEIAGEYIKVFQLLNGSK